MARANTIQTNFTSGEVSPILNGRVDVERYFNGAQEVQNLIVRPQGGLTRRSGLRFINEAKFADRVCRLVRFEFSTTQAYILEFGHEYIRVYKDGGIVEDPVGTPVEIATPYQESELSTLYFAQSADVLYICHPNHQTRTLSRTSHVDWTLDTFISLDGPYLDEHDGDTQIVVSNVVDRATITSTANDFVVGDVGDYLEYDSADGTKTLALVTAFTDARTITVQPLENVVEELEPEVVGDTVTATVAGTYQVSHAVFDTTFTNYWLRIDSGSTGYNAAERWRKCTSYSDKTAARDAINIGAAVTIVVPAVGGTLTLTSRTITATLTASANVWVTSDVGRVFRMKFGDKNVWAKVTAYVSTTVVQVELGGPMPLKERNGDEYLSDGKTKLWRNGAWSESTGWPSCVVFHEQRLFFANTNNQTQTIWGSKSGDYENFAPTEEDSIVSDDNAVTYTIASNTVNEIRWLDSGPSLLIGTVGGEWQLKASSISEPITPTNVSITPQTAYGSLEIQPIRVGPAVIFAQRSGTSMREFVYQFESDSYQASDLNIVSEHLFKVHGTISGYAYQQVPDSIIWAYTSTGVLCSLTYVKDQQVYAWARHVIGGTNAVVESIASIPSGSSDEVWVAVRRTVNGAIVRYVERLDGLFRSVSGTTDKTDAFFVDSGLTYSGAAATVITGLTHLEGETVSVLADGAVVPDKVVSGGQITLTTAATKVHAGLAFTSILHTLPPEGGGDAGTAQGKVKRVHGLTIRVFETIGFKHGPTLASLRERSFRGLTDAMDDSPALFTGDVSFKLNQSYEKDADYYVVQDTPYPLTVLAVMPEMKVNE
jgi:hypothetical protein